MQRPKADHWWPGDGLQPLPEGVGMDGSPLRRLWRVLRYADSVARSMRECGS